MFVCMCSVAVCVCTRVCESSKSSLCSLFSQRTCSWPVSVRMLPSSWRILGWPSRCRETSRHGLVCNCTVLLFHHFKAHLLTSDQFKSMQLFCFVPVSYNSLSTELGLNYVQKSYKKNFDPDSRADKV